jgi:hypothetical protein
MTKSLKLVPAAVLLASLASPVFAKEGPTLTPLAGVEAGEKVSGEVMVVNTETRLMTLKTADGEFVLIHVPPEAERLDQIKIGDKVTVEYSTSILVERIENAPGLLGVSGSEQVTPEEGGRLGGSMTENITIFGKVDGVDASAGTVTVRGENGTETFDVSDPSILSELKAGDGVVVRIRNTLTGTVNAN